MNQQDRDPKVKYDFKVSVSIITYNQREYIQNAIESAIMQEVNFPYEIIIGDDYSTDGTRDILQLYKEQYPNLIKLHLHKQKGNGIAGRTNNIHNIESARGKYIAFLDGDDYWISRNKLQKQADFMDANSDFSMSFHDTLYIRERENKKFYMSERYMMTKNKSVFKLKDLLGKRVGIASSSTFFLADTILPLPIWFDGIYLADQSLQLIAANNGYVKYHNDLLSVWVKNKDSISNKYFKGINFVRVLKNDHKIINNEFKKRNLKIISHKSLFYNKRAAKFYKDRQFIKMIICIYKSLNEDNRIIYKYFQVINFKLNQSIKVISNYFKQ